ncbi:D-2-hydroxyacid dehydrogenase [Eubacterium multiforme]|uniref:D-3-phosphoglycerate dehydrogenase n=1 Tax=Eubacterium multiforme TaxID=83339 RepID=A0ABT9UVJ5_9FIRM|nr:D-2-hydroxyacid dehydrogenase [Eubacterium multiforme]MDQ0150345.1 D-3-phosphoglycerate dehydrogenase [Eubacterium multiforme]
MYKILANDGISDNMIFKFKALGIEVVNVHYSEDELEKVLKEFDVLIVRSKTKVTKEILDKVANSRLKLIIRAGVGLDNIEVDYGKSLGIEIKNTPNASTDSVAELVIGHIFSLARFIGISNVTMREGKWNKKTYKGIEISGKTIGIIGMGRIGQSVAKKAEALGMKVVYYTIEGKHNDLDYDFLSFEDLLKTSDFISIHVPYDKNKGPLIGKTEFKLMKDGIYIINCSRGKVIDEKALVESLNNHKVAGAGLDVFEEEPTNNKELLNHENVSVTPHIGASTIEAQNKIEEEVFSIVKKFFNL